MDFEKVPFIPHAAVPVVWQGHLVSPFPLDLPSLLSHFQVDLAAFRPAELVGKSPRGTRAASPGTRLLPGTWLRARWLGDMRLLSLPHEEAAGSPGCSASWRWFSPCPESTHAPRDKVDAGRGFIFMSAPSLWTLKSLLP